MGSNVTIAPQRGGLAKLELILPKLRELKEKLKTLKSEFSQHERGENGKRRPSTFPITELVDFISFMTQTSKALQKFEVTQQFSTGELPDFLQPTYADLRGIISQAARVEVNGGVNRTRRGDATDRTIYIGIKPILEPKSVSKALSKWNAWSDKLQREYSMFAWNLIKANFDAIDLIDMLEGATAT